MTDEECSHLVGRLASHVTIREQMAALREVTGLQVRLVSVADWPPHKRHADCLNPFCRLMIGAGRSCIACARADRVVAAHAVEEPQTVTCLGGLCQTAVPMRAEGFTIGFVEIGPLTLGEPSEEQFEQTISLLDRWESKIDRTHLRKAFFQSPALSTKRHGAVVRLLIMFAQQASLTAQQFRLTSPDGQMRAVARGRKYIHDHKREPLSLADAARAAKVSTSYFSRMFKKVTEESFTEYLSRIRIEQAREILTSPDVRVGEVAYSVGFQSIPHFNRVFKRLVGESPTAFRARTRAQNLQSKSE